MSKIFVGIASAAAMMLPFAVSAQTLTQFPSTGTAQAQGDWFMYVVTTNLGIGIQTAGQFLIDHWLVFVVLTLGLIFARGMLKKFFGWIRGLFHRT